MTITSVSRVEIITLAEGREVVKYGNFVLSFQDDGRTLKLFETKQEKPLRVWLEKKNDS